MSVKKNIKKKYMKPKRKLRKERLLSKISITEMASYIDISPDTYSKKEKGKYPFYDYEIRVIARKLKLPIEYLFFLD